MATQKSSTKTTAAKKPAAKAKSTTATAKKPVAKKTTTAKATAAPASKARTAAKKPNTVKTTAPQSFRLSRDTQSFISNRITLQTVYWSILAIVILVVGILILYTQLDILETLNQISNS